MDLSLKYEEEIVFALRSLYSKYGYSQYKMNKFEEYDLYVKNKDFLISDSVITFTDTNGKLMALKPDVTLSIVKNSKDIKGYVEKLYYNENVYRVSKGSHSFKEIMQVGLECIGDIDSYCISEVISLAAKSLKEISENAVLSISHLGLLNAILNPLNLSSDLKSQIIKCIEEKNEHELKSLCTQNEIDDNTALLISKLISLYGNAYEVINELKDLDESENYKAAFCEFEKILNLITDENIKAMLQIDFSVVSDAKYYNGIVFKGFIEKIPSSVLSGGQYDSLMKRMNKKSGALGFAVYLDMLDPLKSQIDEFEQDVIILYNENTDPTALKKLTEELISKGNRVSAQKTIPDKLTYRELIDLRK
ncbi:MAG: ATP phosphoribosyltransferase regulatory subunit [Oscillospiraceae bacterium]|nr:ATP phosphoribosyltransferase regulatory subunit [Oscillospiraceae bacterium]